MDPATFSQLLVAGANASPYALITILFLFLFLDTRDSNKREQEWYRKTIEKHDTTLLTHIDILREINRSQAEMKGQQERLERRLEELRDDVLLKDRPQPARRS